MRTFSTALVLLALGCAQTTIRNPELLARQQPITYLGADFTKASIHDPLFDPGTFTAKRVQGWSDIVTSIVHTALPGIAVATEQCDRGNAAFVPSAQFFDPRPWRPASIELPAVEKRIAPWVSNGRTGLGLLVSLERVNAEDRLTALVILFERNTGEVAFTERVIATLEAADPFGATSAYDFGASEESSLIGGAYRPHFEALGRHVARVVAEQAGG